MTPRPLALLALLLGLAGPVLAAGPAADDGAAEIALWKAVIARGQPSDYDGYLLLFPEGRFAALARLRAVAGTAPAQPAPPRPAPPQPATPQPAQARPAAQVPAGMPSLYALDLTPSGRGQPVTVRTRGFLPPALFDLIVVVSAGSPDFTPQGALDEPRMLVRVLAHLYDLERAGLALPSLPPGAYEVRYVSRQYNPEGRNEVMARAALQVP